MRNTTALVAFSAMLLFLGCQQDFSEDVTVVKDTAISDSPFITISVANKLFQDSPDTLVTVKGYISGCIEGNSVKKAKFCPPFSIESNIFLTESRNDTLLDHCFPVQLAIGSESREKLNLMTHPENLHKAVLIRGQLLKYFSRCGMKKVTDWRLLANDSRDTIEENGYIIVPFE